MSEDAGIQMAAPAELHKQLSSLLWRPRNEARVSGGQL